VASDLQAPWHTQTSHTANLTVGAQKWADPQNARPIYLIFMCNTQDAQHAYAMAQYLSIHPSM